MKNAHFYFIKDEFFTDMNDPYLMENKSHSRPHYYCFEDFRTGIYWMIPLSRRVEKYKTIVEKIERKNKTCIILHIVKLPNDR